MPAREQILILGGTAEAAALAVRLVRERPDVEVITSLAGRLASPPDLPGIVRVGGFGGVAGLTDYLRAEKIGRVIDATHPFAATISAHAEQACAALAIPLERIERKMWVRHPGDRWHWADDMAMAARMAAALARRAFLTVGAQELAPFGARGGPFYLIRLIEEPRRDDLVDHVVQAGAVVGVADIHAGALTHGVETAQNLDRAGAIFFYIIVIIVYICHFGFRVGPRRPLIFFGSFYPRTRGDVEDL